jgi:ubiquinone/menaquinone biosynthesis C-methylase UbiE
MFTILKNLLLPPLIKWVVKRPEIMKSKIFLRAMQIFPARVSGSYEQKIKANDANYNQALIAGLKTIAVKPVRILDVCTGTGFAAFKAAEAFPDGALVALDQAPEMLRLASEKAEQEQVTNITFVQGNALKLDYDADTFDLVLTSNAPIYLDEVVRVLMPEGLFLATFSFGGQAIVSATNEIDSYLATNGLDLLQVTKVGSGAYVLGRKPA